MGIPKLKFNNSGVGWFVPLIIATVLLAYFFPDPGIMQHPISLSEVANYGISGIFFFYGLKLNADKLKNGLRNWRVHLLIQTTTFLFFPLTILAVKPLFLKEDMNALWLGLFFLSALPSTVSSSVVMVSLAGGNVASAIFNASISALIGIVLTPLWIGLFFQSAGINIDVIQLVLKLTLQVILPVLIGILLNKHLGHFAQTHKTKLQTFDQSIILLIIYTSFCSSFSKHLFSNMTFVEILFLCTGMLLLFLIVMAFCKLISKLLKFNRGDTIAVIFCGSKKSLVHGTVMAGILFPANSITGYILLPLMIYHAIQLIVSGFLAKRMSVICN